MEKDDSWDSPYRWRELVASKPSEPVEDMTRTREYLISLPYNRDPTTPLPEMAEYLEADLDEIKTDEIVVETEDKEMIKIVVEEYVSKEEKEEENQAVRNKIAEELISNEKAEPEEISEIEESKDESAINSNSKLANKDFDYIKAPITKKPKSVDPIAELRQMSPKNISEDEPPFNFQGMLRKTNFKRESPKATPENVPVYCLKKRQERNEDNKSSDSEKKTEEVQENIDNRNIANDVVNNGNGYDNKESGWIREENENVMSAMEEDKNRRNKEVDLNKEDSGRFNGVIEESEGKRVTVELAPGIIMQGIEVEL
jgi:hypothetical protein